MITRIYGDETKYLSKFLVNFLPLSANAMDSITRFSERTEIYELREDGEKNLIVSFNSDYNSHIWNSPIIWLFGKNLHFHNIFKFLENMHQEGFILLTYDSDVKFDLNSDEYKVYKEDLMILKEHKTEPKLKPVKLTPKDAIRSLQLNYGDSKVFSELQIRREMRFLAERETYGYFYENQLISRGSIMSESLGYSGVGGFITHESFRGLGYATNLISYISNIQMTKGYIPFLTVRSNNEIAKKIYSKIGFTKYKDIIFFDFGTGAMP